MANITINSDSISLPKGTIIRFNTANKSYEGSIYNYGDDSSLDSIWKYVLNYNYYKPEQYYYDNLILNEKPYVAVKFTSEGHNREYKSNEDTINNYGQYLLIKIVVEYEILKSLKSVQLVNDSDDSVISEVKFSGATPYGSDLVITLVSLGNSLDNVGKLQYQLHVDPLLNSHKDQISNSMQGINIDTILDYESTYYMFNRQNAINIGNNLIMNDGSIMYIGNYYNSND